MNNHSLLEAVGKTFQGYRCALHRAPSTDPQRFSTIHTPNAAGHPLYSVSRLEVTRGSFSTATVIDRRATNGFRTRNTARFTSSVTGRSALQPHLNGAIWVKPTLFMEGEHKSWTGDKLLRQASFTGVREDKKV